MTTITHRKGRHRSRPFRVKRLSRWTATYVFDASCAYNIGAEQKDWNKLCGIKRRFFRPMRDSVMVAWRWNDGIELIPYVHVAGGRDFYFDPVKVYPGEPVTVSIDLNTGVTIGGKFYSLPQTWVKGWFINAWFGGTCPAPHRMSIKETKNAALQSGELETTDPRWMHKDTKSE